jgi:hypothetical protein
MSVGRNHPPAITNQLGMEDSSALPISELLSNGNAPPVPWLGPAVSVEVGVGIGLGSPAVVAVGVGAEDADGLDIGVGFEAALADWISINTPML